MWGMWMDLGFVGWVSTDVCARVLLDTAELDKAWELGWGMGRLSQFCKVQVKNSEGSENSKLEPRIPGPYEAVFLKVKRTGCILCNSFLA